MTTTRPSETKTCPYCGKPYPTVVIPALWDIPERTIQTSTCGCAEEQRVRTMGFEHERIRARRDAMRRMGIPKRFWEVPEDPTHLDAVCDGGLFIYGLPGRGKTQLAVATMKAWLNRNRGGRAVFTDANALFGYIRSAYDSGDSERDAIWHFTGADLLVFDDLGKGRPSEWSLEKVESIVQERYESMRPTIYTSQWHGNELVSRLADGGTVESASAIVSRIVGTCKRLKLEGPDLRRSRA